MIRNLLFIIIIISLAAALFLNPNFKTIAAGVAILLFGMVMLEEGFKVFTRGTLQKVLKKATDKLYKSIGIGALVTAFIQSSSLVSVITISFISAGLISLTGGIGLIFGANIGTTMTAWLVAGFGLKIKISALALPMLVFGVLFSFQKKPVLKGIGNILAGLGFFFLGIHYMKEGFDVFKEHIDLTQYAVPGFAGILIFTGLGIIITTILQSSSATLALILTALSAGQIEYENALALAIGANIGTTITALLGSISSNVYGKRLAIAHLLFNLITGVIAVAFIYPLSNLVDYLSDIVGIASTDYTLKLALFHTIFNVIGVIIMVPFVNKLEYLLNRLIKEKKDKDVDEPKFLNETVLEMPSSVALALLNESKFLFENAIFKIVTHALNIHREDVKSDMKVKKIIKKSKDEIEIDIDEIYYKKIKSIYGDIIKYAINAQTRLNLSEELNKFISKIKVANRIMVDIIRYSKELNKNVSKYLMSDNKYIRKEYDKLRKKIVKVLRVIDKFKNEKDKDIFYKKLIKLKEESLSAIYGSNKSIDNLIRKNLITTDMASSLVNDNDNVNKLINDLITVAELLYTEKDSLLENNNSVVPTDKS